MVLILVLIVVFMVLQMLAFGSSAPLQKRSSNCRCSLSCDGAEAELKKHERVEVHVQRQSVEIYTKEVTVSSLFDEKRRCSVVVPECSQGDKRFQLKIFPTDAKKPLYEKMDSKPECDAKKTEERRHNSLSTHTISSSADRISSNTLLILLIMVFFVGFKILPKNWCRFQH